MKIGLDISGGDFAPQNPLEGVAMVHNELPDDTRVVLIGDKNVAEDFFRKKGIDPQLFDYVHSTEVIEMGEHPTKAFSQKPNSTIGIGFRLLKEGKIQAFGSAGNTGAMLVGSMFTIKAVPGVIRPCIATAMPKEKGGYGLLLDVGTNADCKPDVLYQFAVLGKLYSQHVLKVDNPKVALLNIGEEPEKGNLVAQAAYGLMKDSRDFNFVGNVEGRDLFNDKADVIVCEGFVGNVVLKTAEAFYAIYRRRKMKDEYFDTLNYEIYGGTPILGVNGNVIIGHGISSPTAFKNLILQGYNIAKADLPGKIGQVFN